MAARTIAIEGSDGAGKATQTKLLREYYEKAGKKVGNVSYPRYSSNTVGGAFFTMVLRGPNADAYGFSKMDPLAASMFFAGDRRDDKKHVEELIRVNDVVIFDRYVASNLLHQGGKLSSDEERVSFAQKIHTIEYDLLELPKPALTLYLLLPWEVSHKRAASRAEKSGGKLDAVEQDLHYLKSSHAAGEFYAKHFGWSIIDCLDQDGRERTAEEIHAQVISALGR